MGYRIRLHPSGREFIAEPQETLLEAGLRSGINLHYNCSNGSCGECRARVIEGRGEDREFHDFVLSENERNNGMVLLCTTHAASDMLVEARIVGSTGDIPHQQINAKIVKVERLNRSVVMLLLRTPRTQTLRFLAGQHVALHAAGYSVDLPIASCPCNGMMLQFHLQTARDDPLASWLLHAHANDSVMIEGPFGNFILREDSAHTAVMVGVGTGFAPLKGLIEHYINLEKPQPLHLYRIASEEDELYLSNLCDSWRDALDNFSHTPIIVPPGEAMLPALQRIADEIANPSETDLYLALQEETSAVAALELFKRRGIPPEQIMLHHSRMVYTEVLTDVASH